MKVRLFFLIFILFSFNTKAMTTVYVYNIPPYIMNMGKYGIVVDILIEVFKRADIDIHIRHLPLLRAIEKVGAEKNSCVAPLQRTQEREYHFSWVGPLVVSNSSIFTKASTMSKAKFIYDLEGSSIGVLRGSSEASYINSIIKAKLQEAKEEVQNIRKLNAQRFTYWLTDYGIGKHLARVNDIKIKEVLRFRKTLRSLACSKDISQEKLKKLNHALREMYGDGTIEKMLKKKKLK